MRRAGWLAVVALSLACSEGGSGSDADTGSVVETDAAVEDGVEEELPPPPPDPYTVTVFDNTRIHSRGNVNVRNATEVFEWRDGPFAEVKLVVELDSTCYPFEKWQTNLPPSGQTYPADCDAFDRNFEFTMDDPVEDGDLPAVELVRAITPFGGPMQFEVDVTDIANGLPGEHTLRVHIGTWSDGAGQVSGSDGGWNVTARFEVTPGEPPREVTAVIPVYNGSIRNSTELPNFGITLPPGTARSRVEYRTTGHGGGTRDSACTGHADEFCQREHTVNIRESFTFVPWRDDCAELCTFAKAPDFMGGFDYCVENPLGAIRSVRASRANWCPGNVTPPYVWDIAALSSGPHTATIDIANIADGGSWRTSLLVIGYAD